MHNYLTYFLAGVLPATIITFGFYFILRQNNLKFNLKKLLVTIFLGGVLAFIPLVIIDDFIPRKGRDFVEIFTYIFWPATFSFLLGWSIEWKNTKTTFDNLILKKTHLKEEKEG